MLALQAVENGMSHRKAVEQFKVPRVMLGSEPQVQFIQALVLGESKSNK